MFNKKNKAYMKKIILTVAVAFSALWAFSQSDAESPRQQNRHEFYLGGGGGISSLHYRPTIGDRHYGLGGMAGLGYTYYFNYNWGLSIGAEYQLLKGKYTLDHSAVGSEVDFVDEYLVTSPDFDILRVSPRRKLTEKQEATYINIPIVARFEFDFPWKNKLKITKFSAGAGLKVGIPMDAKYKSEGGLEVTGLDLITRDPYNFNGHGFGDVNYAYDDKFSTNLNFIGTLEAGLKWQFNTKWGLYTGLFADLGLNDIVKRGNARNDLRNARNFYDYNYANPASPTINTIFLSNYGRVDNINGGVEREERYAKCVRTFAVGLKVAVTFGMNPFDKQVKKKAVPVVVPSDPWDQPVTGKQMRQLLQQQSGELTEAQREEFEKLKKFLEDELKDPDLSAPVFCFDFDRDNIPADAKEVLDHKVELLKKYPLISLILEGHTDAAGSDMYNYKLALRRAETAKSYLVSKGIASSRLTVTSKGKTRPIVTGSTDEKVNCPNRRVEFIINK
jgi:outer membrane protein OmpA-like peptidoglycan-associated protein